MRTASLLRQTALARCRGRLSSRSDVFSGSGCWSRWFRHFRQRNLPGGDGRGWYLFPADYL